MGYSFPLTFIFSRWLKPPTSIYIYIHAQFVQHIEFTQLYSLYLLIDSGGSWKARPFFWDFLSPGDSIRICRCWVDEPIAIKDTSNKRFNKDLSFQALNDGKATGALFCTLSSCAIHYDWGMIFNISHININPAMPRRVVVAAKHSFSYPGARPCRRPSPKILQPAGVFTFLGVRGGKKEGKIWRCLLEVLVGRFLVDFWPIFHNFLVLSSRKNREFTLFLCLWHPKKASDNMQETA